MADSIRKRTQALADKLIHYRRMFHQYPETGWTEFRTTDAIIKALNPLGVSLQLGHKIHHPASMMGVPDAKELERQMERAVSQGADPGIVEKMAGGFTGVVADFNCGPGPFVVLRFDMDANALTESCGKNHRPFKQGFSSKNKGVMHACGHDGHAAMGIGVAMRLSELKDRIKGRVRLIFQPAEEGVRGAASMVDAGMVDNADYILGGHIGLQASRTGQLICGTQNFLATTKFDVAFDGISAHAGAHPEQGQNALLAGACAAVNLQAIPRHSRGASRINVGTLQAGEGRNSIPSHALMQVETRGATSAIDRFLFKKAMAVVQGAALMHGVDHKITIQGQAPAGDSDDAMIQKIRQASGNIPFFVPEEIHKITDAGCSEDFAGMLTRVQRQGGKGCYFMLGANLSSGHHTPGFDFDESCLAAGVELMVATTLDLLGPKI